MMITRSWQCYYGNHWNQDAIWKLWNFEKKFPPIFFCCLFFSLSQPVSTVQYYNDSLLCVSLWEGSPVKDSPRHKMASDSPTQSLLGYTHIHAHLHAHCQSHTEHSGKSRLREQPLCVRECWSFLKRFTAVRNSRPPSLLITTPWTC